jgi:2-desacetyl-2-hydroxyethyl bacteriochlorophyllide A dehydrogenase
MRAVVCRKPGELELEDRPEPLRRDDEALVQIRQVGICGTDFHIFEGSHPYLDYPRVMGHELSAEVLEAPVSSRHRRGDIVVVNPYISCGTCFACRNGKPNCCVRIAVLGVHRDGGMCERLSLPDANLYPAKGLSAEHAACVEFLAIGAHGVARSGLRKGVRALVIGAGPIGLGAAIFAGLAGGEVALMDRDAARLAFAASAIGAADTIVAGDDVADQIAARTGGDGFEVVIDATGNEKSMQSSFQHVAHGGALVFISVVSGPICFSDPEFHKREMTLIGSRNALREDFERVATAIDAGRVPLDRLVTHRTSLAETAGRLPHWASQKEGLVKALIDVRG